MNFNIFSFFNKKKSKKPSDKQVEKEAVERAFKTGNVIIARRKEDGSIDWQEIEIKK